MCIRDSSSFPEVWETPTKKSGPRQTVSFSLEVTPPDTHVIQNNCELFHSLRYKTPMEIYTLISQPFSHTSGFHSLLTYLRRRFNKRDLVEMCRSLAEFRPIFIACSVTLTEEDMIFMEQSYQRTLLELSLIHISIALSRPRIRSDIMLSSSIDAGTQKRKRKDTFMPQILTCLIKQSIIR